jgi:hypothetical protein
MSRSLWDGFNLNFIAAFIKSRHSTIRCNKNGPNCLLPPKSGYIVLEPLILRELGLKKLIIFF